MSDKPHPADYMSDASYEQFMRDGGISDAEIRADVLNDRYEPEEELLVEHHSGAWEDLSEEVLDAVEATFDEPFEKLEELDGGDWITVVDGEVVEMSEFCPHTIRVKLFI